MNNKDGGNTMKNQYQYEIEKTDGSYTLQYVVYQKFSKNVRHVVAEFESYNNARLFVKVKKMRDKEVKQK